MTSRFPPFVTRPSLGPGFSGAERRNPALNWTITSTAPALAQFRELHVYQREILHAALLLRMGRRWATSGSAALQGQCAQTLGWWGALEWTPRQWSQLHDIASQHSLIGRQELLRRCASLTGVALVSAPNTLGESQFETDQLADLLPELEQRLSHAQAPWTQVNLLEKEDRHVLGGEQRPALSRTTDTLHVLDLDTPLEHTSVIGRVWKAAAAQIKAAEQRGRTGLRWIEVHQPALGRRCRIGVADLQRLHLDLWWSDEEDLCALGARHLLCSPGLALHLINGQAKSYSETQREQLYHIKNSELPDLVRRGLVCCAGYDRSRVTHQQLLVCATPAGARSFHHQSSDLHLQARKTPEALLPVPDVKQALLDFSAQPHIDSRSRAMMLKDQLGASAALNALHWQRQNQLRQTQVA